MNPSSQTPLRIAWVSSYVPKRCGIATFSRDLIKGIELADPTAQISIAATEGGKDELTYGPTVVATTHTSSQASFVQAARKLSAKDPHVLVLQHEYGLFGGAHTDFERDGRHYRYPLGDNIFALLEATPAPLVVTLHTVLSDPDPARRDIIRRLADRSAAMITMTQGAKDLLVRTCDLPESKVLVIPHGVPSVTPIDPIIAKKRLNLPSDERIMMITGLIGPNKGVEMMLRALPEILANDPKIKLYVVGQTHPDILTHTGEAYREHLVKVAGELGVGHALKFVNRYLPLDELVEYLQAADIYLTLHGDPEQAASGTLAYAMGAGLIAISTPYRYAEEVLADGRGFLVPFNDSAALSTTVNKVMNDAELFAETRRLSMTYGASMSWPIVGRSYANLLHDVASKQPA